VLILFSFDCRAQCPQALADLLATAVKFFDPADSPNGPSAQIRDRKFRAEVAIATFQTSVVDLDISAVQTIAAA